MRFGIVGLGRIGAALARQALEQGHEVVGFNADATATEALAHDGLEPADGLAALAARLTAPRVVLVYVPHGEPTEQVCRDLRGLLERRDLVVDGGNSHWADSERRHREFAGAGLRFLDMGTSGGVRGARHGACFMAGGDPQAWELVRPLLEGLAVAPAGAALVGGAGAGHFTKLVHNAIEFGMLQAIGEGVELMVRSGRDLDLPVVFDNWAHGSVIRSWLVELMAEGLRAEPDLDALSTYVEDTGEVKWVLDWALDKDVPTPVTSAAQNALMAFRDVDWPAAKAVALLRHGFGEHPVRRAGEGGR